MLSRSQIFPLEPVDDSEIVSLLHRAATAPQRGLGYMKLDVTEEALAHLALKADGDVRKALTALEVAVLSTPAAADGVVHVDLAVAEESIQKKAIKYDRAGDGHYDTISAFIKSMRGSDPDAALYWLAYMLNAGEDIRFIARRLVICASEDVGMADSNALRVALAAAQAFEVPSTYTTIFVTTTGEVTGKYSTSTDIAFLLQNDLTFSGLIVMDWNAGERIFTSADPSELSSLTFTSDSDLYVDSGEKLTLAGLNAVTFQSGSAEYSSSDANNNPGYKGGAIFAQGTGSITLLDNVSVNFTNNSSSYGGAIYSSSGAITLSENGHVEFIGNSARSASSSN